MHTFSPLKWVNWIFIHLYLLFLKIFSWVKMTCNLCWSKKKQLNSKYTYLISISQIFWKQCIESSWLSKSCTLCILKPCEISDCATFLSMKSSLPENKFFKHITDLRWLYIHWSLWNTLTFTDKNDEPKKFDREISVFPDLLFFYGLCLTGESWLWNHCGIIYIRGTGSVFIGFVDTPYQELTSVTNYVMQCLFIAHR